MSLSAPALGKHTSLPWRMRLLNVSPKPCFQHMNPHQCTHPVSPLTHRSLVRAMRPSFHSNQDQVCAVHRHQGQVACHGRPGCTFIVHLAPPSPRAVAWPSRRPALSKDWDPRMHFRPCRRVYWWQRNQGFALHMCTMSFVCVSKVCVSKVCVSRVGVSVV